MATIAFLFALVIPFLVTLTASSAIHSTVPANPLPYRTTQPDGSMTPQLQFWGDGTDNFVSDENGYVVVKDGGWLVYAQNEASIDSTESDERKSLRSRRLGKSSGSSHLVPSQHVVGSVDPSALSGLTTVQQRKIHSQKHRRLHQDTVVTPHQPRKLFTNTTGATFQFQSLILLLRFADHTDRELPTASQFIKFFNKRDLSLTNNDIAPTGSINELFWENSYGMLDARAKVVDWITLSETEEYYANGEYGFQKFLEGIQEALGQLFEGNELEDIERIDGLGILHSGYGAEYGGEDCFGQENVNRIWSHQAGSLKFVNPHSNFDTGKDDAEQGIGALVVPERYYVASALRNKCGSEITRVGIVAHEMGHQLGLPDLYDKTFAGNGAGNYDPMSKSWGWDGTGLYPPVFSAWSKMTLGWVNPLEITSNGHYYIGASANVAQVYIIRQGFADGEYLLIENRQPEGFDSQLEGGGIAVWHIDEHANDERGYLGQKNYPWNGNHYKVALLQADGNQDLERGLNNGDATDLWHRDGEFTVLGPSAAVDADAYIVPNTDSNRYGNVTSSRVWLHNFTASGEYMGFTVHGLGVNENTSKGYPHPNSLTSGATVNATQLSTTSPSSQPSVDPWNIMIYYPDWIQLGCRRKELALFNSWENSRYDSIGECCSKSMEWAYSECVQASVKLMGFDLTPGQIEGTAPIQMRIGHNTYFAAPPP